MSNAQLTTDIDHGHHPCAGFDCKPYHGLEIARITAVLGRMVGDVMGGKDQPPLRRGVSLNQVRDVLDLWTVPTVKKVRLEVAEIDGVAVELLATATTPTKPGAGNAFGCNGRPAERVGKRFELDSQTTGLERGPIGINGGCEVIGGYDGPVEVAKCVAAELMSVCEQRLQVR